MSLREVGSNPVQFLSQAVSTIVVILIISGFLGERIKSGTGTDRPSTPEGIFYGMITWG